MLDAVRSSRLRLFTGAAIGLGLLAAAPQFAAAADAASPALQAELDKLETEVVRAEDVKTIESLQRAYGHYADRGLWEDLADLFANDALADYPSGVFVGKPSIRNMFIKNLGAGRPGLADGRIYAHIILQPVVDLAPDGKTATGRWRVLGMLGRFGANASWADSLYRFDYVKQPDGAWKIKQLITYAGTGGGYDNGWSIPAPRPPGFVDRSPVVFNLAHPADRPRGKMCEDATTCVVPFPYPNRGSLKTPAKGVSAMVVSRIDDPQARAADLIGRAERLQAEKQVLNLQRAYGYYMDRAMWAEAAGLFAPDGTREVGQRGVYVGRDHVRKSLEANGPLRPGQLNDHLQLEPIVTVAPDGRTAKARVLELAFVGGGGQPGRIVQNIHENDYVRRGGVWQIQNLHSYTILGTDYDQGWAKSANPAPAPSKDLPPDRPPTVVYEAYPKVFTPWFHFGNPSTGKPAQYAPEQTPPAPPPIPVAAAPAPKGPLAPRIAEARRLAQRAMDYNEIENLQNAYGYYAEKSLWTDIPLLFAAKGVLAEGEVLHQGPGAILAYLKASGPEGPVKNALNSQFNLQPVIDVAPDGRTARIRSRMLQLARDGQGKPMWGGGVYENQLVKENGVWKFARMQFYRTYKVHYAGGWAKPEAGEGLVYPTTFTPPFHYAARSK
jgi:hypothetical protein